MKAVSLHARPQGRKSDSKWPPVTMTSKPTGHIGGIVQRARFALHTLTRGEVMQLHSFIGDQALVRLFCDTGSFLVKLVGKKKEEKKRF